MPTRRTKAVAPQQQEQRSSWWNWRSKTSRETTPAPESALESSSKTVYAAEVVLKVKEEDEVDENGKMHLINL